MSVICTKCWRFAELLWVFDEWECPHCRRTITSEEVVNAERD